jgi:putative tryptophan/tyrosine transport system substrate-binding protein
MICMPIGSPSSVRLTGIVVAGSPLSNAMPSPSARAAKSTTSTIPIVFDSADPVGEGLVASLARPGGNLTGFSIMAPDLEPKRLELLSELVPQAGVIVLLANPNNPNTGRMIRHVQEPARVAAGSLKVVAARLPAVAQTGGEAVE